MFTLLAVNSSPSPSSGTARKFFPSYGSQEGWTILSRVQSHVDLLEEAVCKIVDYTHQIGCQQIGDGASGVFLEHDLHLEFAFGQVQEIVLRIDLKGHGVDSRVERIDLDSSSSVHAEIRGGYLEHVQTRITRPRRSSLWDQVRHRRRRFLLALFLLAAISAFCTRRYLSRFDRVGSIIPPLYTRRSGKRLTRLE